MPAEWSTYLAVVLIFILLGYILYLRIHRTHQTRKRELNNSLPQQTLTKEAVQWNMLTPRQKQVAKLMLSGMSKDEIAEHLHIGSTTVNTHMHLIYKTLSVHSRAEFITKYRDFH